MLGCMTTNAASGGRATLLDRIAYWTLDHDGDIYGDERERLRWYEGIATAATIQWIATPWAAAVLVWTLGRPAVLPLAVLMIIFYVPMLVCHWYVRRRRVETDVQTWSRKRFIVAALSAPPYILFLVGCAWAFIPPGGTVVSAGTIVRGMITGVMAFVLSVAVGEYRRRRFATTSGGDDD